MVYNWLFFTLFLFIFSLFGIIYNNKNLIITLIIIEILLFSVILNFIFFSISLNLLYGYFYSILVLGIAAAETTLGLTLVISFFKSTRKDLQINRLVGTSL
ncbi:NADH-quinone oxidoreductase subunit K [Arcobacter sp.]|uniref:NADH-quinone oxidoreductase subunit K n=1 Tax=Arcobacter sp. TaxID=1872629 RepID=UPI003D0B5F9D